MKYVLRTPFAFMVISIFTLQSMKQEQIPLTITTATQQTPARASHNGLKQCFLSTDAELIGMHEMQLSLLKKQLSLVQSCKPNPLFLAMEQRIIEIVQTDIDMFKATHTHMQQAPKISIQEQRAFLSDLLQKQKSNVFFLKAQTSMMNTMLEHLSITQYMESLTTLRSIFEKQMSLIEKLEAYTKQGAIQNPKQQKALQLQSEAVSILQEKSKRTKELFDSIQKAQKYLEITNNENTQTYFKNALNSFMSMILEYQNPCTSCLRGQVCLIYDLSTDNSI
ncbi:MAG: hypothetical protein UU47_C0001G0088 [candidate division TM6 bacterium GW2011_GWE2_41_16]|nr:MAG: hypothetical protein UU47_C0001G0088 [candidate division TM6 bacterium GW2011_GWE2_41_16]